MPPPVKTIKAAEAIRCIRAGMDDSALMERFDVTAKGLQSLFDKMVGTGILTRSELEQRASLFYESGSMRVVEAKFPAQTEIKPRVKIFAIDVLNCLRVGMDDVALMKRYNLSASGLERLFKKMVGAGTISAAELEKRMPPRHTDVEVEEPKVHGLTIDTEVSDTDLTVFLKSIITGGTRDSLMQDYGLSQAELELLMGDLVSRGLATQEELDRLIPDERIYLEIRHRISEQVIFSGKARSVRALIEAALSACVDLSDADLRGVNLARADLSRGRFCRADMTKVILVGADLSRAQLTGAVLTSAEMSGSTMYKTNLSQASLCDANMTMIQGVSMLLCWADLSEANLTNANLVGANLVGAKLFQTIFKGANLSGAYVEGTKLEATQTNSLNGPDTSESFEIVL
jgi:uncharacterized protein YjbI with pentapeptide repeats